MPNGEAFSGISGKEGNLSRYTKLFAKFLLGISVLFDFPRRIFSGILVCSPEIE